MLQTLFLIPERVGSWPLFGAGIIFWLLIVGTALSAFRSWRRGGWTAELTAMLTTNALIALVVWQVIPRLMIDYHGARGIPIRGYGVMLLLGVAAGVGLAIWRAPARGFSVDDVLNLAFYLFFTGIVGGRVFYVVQKWSLFQGAGWAETFVDILNFTEGGLVVYGALFGAAAGFMIFVFRSGLPALQLADLIAPSLLVGLALGRVGCLLNGCCYGGPSDVPWALRFPASSPPFQSQLESGQLFGIELGDRDGQVVIERILAGSPAASSSLVPGMVVERVDGELATSAAEVREQLAGSPHRVRIDATDASGALSVVDLSMGPSARSLPTEPTQVYSAINAALLCALALAIESRLSRPGLLIATTLGLYALTRFLEEIIRRDEGSFAGTGLTISQNISVLVFLAALALGWWAARRGRTPPRVLSSTVAGLVALVALFGISCRPLSQSESRSADGGALGGSRQASADTQLSWSDAVAAVARGESRTIVSTDAALPGSSLGDLSGLDGLRQLHVRSSQIRDEDLTALAGLSQLEEVRLDHAPVGDAGAAQLALLPGLRSVNLPDARFTDAGLASLARMPKLELLRFHSPNVTDTGMQSLADARSLRFLHLIDVPISDRGLEPLGQLQGLESLYVDGGGVTEAGLARLLESLPELHLHWNMQHLPGDLNHDNH